jgi:hypothetical protein
MLSDTTVPAEGFIPSHHLPTNEGRKVQLEKS